ncbi:MAG TPA: phosphopantetheine-binding protein, partial [Vicinamibacteria bacterium]|nr:phosphopantetheine-binding protein [Vicinamibacteria bacterium]
RALRQPLPQLLVSTIALEGRLAQSRPRMETAAAEVLPEVAPRHPRPELGTPYVAPGDEIEQIVAATWQELLGFEQVGIHDNFFDLGGHSLLLVQVHRRLRERFPDRELSVTDLFTHSTVAAVAAWLSADPVQRAAPPGEEVAAEAAKREAGRERLGRRRGMRSALAGLEETDA